MKLYVYSTMVYLKKDIGDSLGSMKTVSHLQKLLIGYILSLKKILILALLFPKSKHSSFCASFWRQVFLKMFVVAQEQILE